jgi:hypothetical protein
MSTDSCEADDTLPPLAKAETPLHTVLTVYLDTEKPLSEPKWVKSGDVQEWLKSMFGRMFWVAGDAADGWEKRIEVVDPDPVSRPSVLSLVLCLSCSLCRHRRFGLFSKGGHPTHLQAPKRNASASSARI